MDPRITAVVEGLAERFANLPLTVVVRILTDVAARHPDATPDELERTSRAALDAATRDRRTGSA